MHGDQGWSKSGMLSTHTSVDSEMHTESHLALTMR